MTRNPAFLLLPLTLAAVLAGCSKDEPTDAAKSATEASTSAAPVPPGQAQTPSAKTPYERALRELVDGIGNSYEIEYTLADGSIQYLTGGRSQRNHAFVVRTLPTPNDQLDGQWVMQAGRFLKFTDGAYTDGTGFIQALQTYTTAVQGLPAVEMALRSEVKALESVNGIGCRPRQIDLSQEPRLARTFLEIGVCIDEDQAHILRLDAAAHDGTRLRAHISAHGQAYAVPDVGVKEWWEHLEPK